MKTEVKQAKPRSARLPKLEAPKLSRIIFSELSSKVPTDEHGTPIGQGRGKAYLELSVSLGCKLGTESSSSQPSASVFMAALTVEIGAQATSESVNDVFYSGNLTAIGYVTFDEKLTKYDLESNNEIFEKYFKASYDSIYAVAARELHRLIENTGLNPPPVPLSLDMTGMTLES